MPESRHSQHSSPQAAKTARHVGLRAALESEVEVWVRSIAQDATVAAGPPDRGVDMRTVQALSGTPTCRPQPATCIRTRGRSWRQWGSWWRGSPRRRCLKGEIASRLSPADQAKFVDGLLVFVWGLDAMTE